MERAGNFLGGMLRQLKRPEAAVAWLSGVWPSVVGKTLARHTRPVRCHKGCLEVAADGKAWRKQLEEMKSEFCTQVNKAWGSALGSRSEIRRRQARPATHLPRAEQRTHSFHPPPQSLNDLRPIFLPHALKTCAEPLLY